MRKNEHKDNPHFFLNIIRALIGGKRGVQGHGDLGPAVPHSTYALIINFDEFLSLLSSRKKISTV